MTFKDEVQNDIPSAFINFDEFATFHAFDNENILLIEDDDQLQQQGLKDAAGTYKGTKLLHVPSASLKGRPAIGARITYDTKTYTVKNVVDNEGILTITLDINKSIWNGN